MKKQLSILACTLVIGVGAVSSHAWAQAKTAKACTEEWRADKAGFQAKGITEKAYVADCRAGTASTPAAAPAPAPTAAAPRPMAPTATTTDGQKTAKACTEEWRADKAGFQAKGMTEKAYVADCRAGAPSTPAASPAPAPTAAAPRPMAPAATATAGEKTAKACTEEWRADKAGFQAKGITEKAYVADCRAGTATTPAAAPAPAPTAAAPRPMAPTATTAAGQKTAKACTEEWRADKAGFQAKGITEKAYVADCRAGTALTPAAAPAPAPTAAAPAPSPATAAPPPAAPRPTAASPAQAPAVRLQ